MKERGIIFNGEMVRAILSGHKTHTRRVMKVQPAECNHIHWPEHPQPKWEAYDDGWHCGVCGNGVSLTKRDVKGVTCHLGQVGDRLWVREAWSLLGNEDGCAVDWHDNIVFDQKNAARIYRASCWQKPNNYGLWSIPDHDYEFEGRWKPSIHMPRWASRILLEITDVRVERLNDISEEDCWAEGIDAVDGRFENAEIIDMAVNMGCCIDDAKPMFALLWQSIYGEESWDANPWVWAITFKRIEVA